MTKALATRVVYHVARVRWDTDWKWAVKREGEPAEIYYCETQKLAIEAAKKLAKAAPLGQVVVHGRNGRIRLEYTYGKDPERHKG